MAQFIDIILKNVFLRYFECVNCTSIYGVYDMVSDSIFAIAISSMRMGKWASVDRGWNTHQTDRTTKLWTNNYKKAD